MNKLFTNEDIKKLIWPLIVEQFLAILVGVMDTIMVSSCGDAAVSGLALVDSINILLINIFAALATGGAVVASQYLGQYDKRNASESIKQLIYTMLFISLVICFICIFFKFELLSLIFGNVDYNVMDNAQTYFTISCLSYPFIALYNCGAAAFRSQGNSKISMKSSIIMNCLNIGGNALLIYGFNMGVAGAATSSLVARFVGMFIILRLLKNEELKIHIDNYFDYQFNAKMIKNILKIGIPTGLENGMFQLGKILVQRIVTVTGTIGITAYAVSSNLNAIMCIPGMAIGLAMISVVGACCGAQDYDQARYYIKKLLKYAYLFMCIVNVCIVVMMPLIFKVYNVSDDALDVASKCVFIHALGGCFIWPLAFSFPNALRASNNATFTMIISIISMFINRLFLAYIFIVEFKLGLEFIFVAMVIDWIFRAIAFVIYYKSGKWEKAKLV